MRASLIPVVSEDVATLISFMRQYQDDDPWCCPFEDERSREVVKTLMEDPSLGRAFLIHADGKSVGYIVLTFDFSLEFGGRCAWVDEFFVQKEFRGKGLGGDALRLFAEEAKKLGAKTVHLGVKRGNPAIELYRRAGFEEHDGSVMTKWL